MPRKIAAKAPSQQNIPGPTSGRQVNPSEVGWQFVPQYYTFVNKHPHRLHCFYTKNSTFINGTEGEDGKACYGQHEIHQKILSLNYHDCKVFIHSVDAQSSANNGIITQVIGEMSNRGEPWKKFVQTFFLAEQPNGYFVLNDIFRFLKEDTTGEEPAAATPQVPPAPSGPKTWATLAASNNRKWGNQIATDAKGVSAAAPQSPAPSPALQMPAAGPNTTPKGPVEVTTGQCFVKAVTDNVTEAALKETLISRFGPVKELEIVRSKACAFLEFASPEAARKAIAVSLPAPQGEGGIRLEGKLGPNGMPPRVIVETRKERSERPVPTRGRGGPPGGIRLWGMLGRGGSSPIVETSKEEPERPIATREWGGPLSDEGRENAAAG